MQVNGAPELPFPTLGPFAPQEHFHSTRTNCGNTHFFGMFTPRELGTVLVPGTLFGGTKLAPTSK